MNLTIRQLQFVVSAAEVGSFSKAAERLGISQPAFSGAIQRIEQEIGYRLFDRNTRSLQLTAEGRHVVAIARDLLRDFHKGLEKIRHGANKGKITLAVLPSIVSAVMSAALKRFSDRFPDVDVAIHDVPQARGIAMVLDGGADLGVTTPASERPALHFTDIGADRFVALLPSGHELASEPQVRWRDVARSPFIALTELSSIRRVTEAAFIAADVAPRIRCEVEQISSCVALVEAGHGVTALPTSAIPMVRGHDVSVRPLIGPVTRRRIGIARLAHKTLSSAEHFMADVLEGSLRSVLGRRV